MITLGIIGVVAALTIPMLITNYQKRVVETRLKAIYSTILQGFRMHQAYSEELNFQEDNYGDADGNGYSKKRSRDFSDAYFAPVFPGVTSYPDSTNFNIYSTDGSHRFSYDVTGLYNVYYSLANGTVLGFTRAGNYEGCSFLIIMNPQKSRLFAGKDVFFMTFTLSEFGDWEYGSAASTHYEQSKHKDYIEYCKATVSYPAYYTSPFDFCTVLIIKNSFKVPDDYPIRF